MDDFNTLGEACHREHSGEVTHLRSSRTMMKLVLLQFPEMTASQYIILVRAMCLAMLPSTGLSLIGWYHGCKRCRITADESQPQGCSLISNLSNIVSGYHLMRLEMIVDIFGCSISRPCVAEDTEHYIRVNEMYCWGSS